MTTRTDVLRIKLETDGDGKVKASLAGVEKGFEKADKKARNLSKSLSTYNKSIGSIVTKLGLMGAAAVTALGYLTDRSLQSADAIGKTADKLGLGVEALQEWRYAARAAGIESATADMAIQRFGRRLGEASDEGGELRATLERMKVEVRNADGTLRDVDPVLTEFLTKLGQIEGVTVRNALAMKGFDSEGVKMVQLAQRGADGMQALRNRARDLGIVMSEDLVRGAEDANEQLETLKQVLGIQLTQAVVQLAPEIGRLAQQMIDHKQDIADFAEKLFAVGKAALEAGAATVDFIYKVSKGLSIIYNGQTQYPYEKEVVRAKGHLEDLEQQLVSLQSSQTDQSPAIASLRTEIEAARLELEKYKKLQEEAIVGPPNNNNKPQGSKDDKGAAPPKPTPFVLTEVDPLQDAATKYIESLRQEAALMGENTRLAQVRYALEFGELSKLNGAKREELLAAAQLADARELEVQALEEADALKKRQREELEQWIDTQARALDSEVEAENRRYSEALAQLKQAEEAKIQTLRPYHELRERMQQEHSEKLSEIERKAREESNEFVLQAARNIQSALGEELLGVMEGNFDNIGDAFSRMLQRMAAEAAAAELAKALMGDYGKTGQIGGLVGSAAGGIGDFLGGLFFSIFHGGGIAGQDAPARFLPASTLSGAPRYHNGLRQNEVPAILEQGEEVLTANDPRHSANGGGSGVTVINNNTFQLIDTKDLKSRIGEISQDIALMTKQAVGDYNL